MRSSNDRPLIVTLKKALSYYFIQEDESTSLTLKRLAILNNTPISHRKRLLDTQRCDAREFTLRDGFLWHAGSKNHVFTIKNIENTIAKLPIEFQRASNALRFVDEFENITPSLCKLTQRANELPFLIKQYFEDFSFTVRGTQFNIKSTSRLCLPPKTNVDPKLAVKFLKLDARFEDVAEFKSVVDELEYGRLYFANRVFQVVLKEDDDGNRTNVVLVLTPRLSETPMFLKTNNLLSASVSRDVCVLFQEKSFVFTHIWCEKQSELLQAFILTKLKIVYDALNSSAFTTVVEKIRERELERPDLIKTFVAAQKKGYVAVLWDAIEIERGGEVDLRYLESVIEATQLDRDELLRRGRHASSMTLEHEYYRAAIERKRVDRQVEGDMADENARRSEGERLKALQDRHDEREAATAAAAAAAAKEREAVVKAERERRRDAEGSAVRPHYQITFSSVSSTKHRTEPSLEHRLRKAEFEDGKSDRTALWEANRMRDKEIAQKRRANDSQKRTLNARLRRELPDLEEQYAFKHVNDLSEWSGNAKPLSKIKELPECGGRRTDSDDEFDTESVATSAMTLFKSRHASQRQAERCVSDCEIKGALKHGIVTRFTSGKSISRREGLCIVHDEKHIITAYREEEGNVRGKERTR